MAEDTHRDEDADRTEDAASLELPNGDVVTPEDVFLYNGYPYRYEPLEGEEHAFQLSPLYWGGGEMDVPFRERAALVEQWGPEAEGLLTEEGWREWLADAREDDRFDDAELDAVARELPIDAEEGLLDRLRAALGL